MPQHKQTVHRDLICQSTRPIQERPASFFILLQPPGIYSQSYLLFLFIIDMRRWLATSQSIRYRQDQKLTKIDAKYTTTLHHHPDFSLGFDD